MPGSLDRPGRSSLPEQQDALKAPQQLSREPPREADWAERADHLDIDEPPRRWSRADLQQRLERLPSGHPSSPEFDEPEPELQSVPTDSPPDDRLEAERHDQPDAPKRDYWAETPALLRAAEDHQQRWPQEHVTSAVDRSRDPEGSWRGNGNQYLDPECHSQAKDGITRIRRAEKTITDDLKLAEREAVCHGWLEGLNHRLKGDDRLKEKAAEKVEHEPGKSIDTAMHQVSDAIRYTFCFEPEHYSEGYLDVKCRLEQREYQMIYCKNHWQEDSGYKGINTRWVTPGGQRFEIQFHTAESFDAKQHATHWSYERLRNPLTNDAERMELRSYQREVSSWISLPEGVSTIENYPLKGYG